MRDWSARSLGWAGDVASAALVVGGVVLLAGRARRGLGGIAAALALLLVGSAGLADLAGGSPSTPRPGSASAVPAASSVPPSGGLAGVIGVAGACVVLGAICLAAICGLLGMPLLAVIRVVGRGLLALWRWAWGLVGAWVAAIACSRPRRALRRR